MSLPEQDFSVSKFHFHENVSPNNTFPSVSRIQLFTFINNLIFYSPAFKYHYYEWVSCPFLSKWDNVSQNNTFHSNIITISGIIPLAFFVQLVIYVCMKSWNVKLKMVQVAKLRRSVARSVIINHTVWSTIDHTVICWGNPDTGLLSLLKWEMTW